MLKKYSVICEAEYAQYKCVFLRMTIKNDSKTCWRRIGWGGGSVMEETRERKQQNF